MNVELRLKDGKTTKFIAHKIRYSNDSILFHGFFGRFQDYTIKIKEIAWFNII